MDQVVPEVEVPQPFATVRVKVSARTAAGVAGASATRNRNWVLRPNFPYRSDSALRGL